MTAPLTARPHPRQSEIDALRVKLLGSGAISKALRLTWAEVSESFRHHDAAMPVMERLVRSGMSASDIAKARGVSSKGVWLVLEKLPLDVQDLAHLWASKQRNALNADYKKHKYSATDQAWIDDVEGTREELSLLITQGVPRYDNVQVSL